MAAPSPTSMEPEQAAAVLKTALSSHRGDLTVADAAAKAGLSLRDAERGLQHLVTQYPGQLSATSEGELLFRFPRGFTRPLFERPGWLKFWDKTKRSLLGIGKFVVRAWISVVLIGYVAVFLAIALAWAFRGGSDDDDSGSNAFGLVYVLLRVVAEALFWTFHPFSPFAARSIYDDPRVARRDRRGRAVQKKEPFYTRVNRFVFGPEEEKVDPRDVERGLLAHIRAAKGRIGLTDVMKMTGLPREEADAMLARLMLDYDGEVEVSEQGGIFYKFPALRRTAGADSLGGDGAPVPPPVWTKKKAVLPLTGNPISSNLLIAGLNAFNLMMSFVALQANLTIDRVRALIEGVPVEVLPYDGIPVVLGLIPFVFSSLLFALPMWRLATDGARKKRVARENARRSLLQVVLDSVSKGGAVDEAKLKKAWQEAAGEAPTDAELVSEVVKLGGDLNAERGAALGHAQFRFRDLEAEVLALQKERAEASAAEAEVGAVVYSSGS